MAQRASGPMDQRVLPRHQRQRKLPVMNSSERGKYYRRLNKEMEIQREEHVQFLRREVDRLEIQLQIARCLDQLLLAPSLSEVSSFLSHFITERLDASPSTLKNSQVDVRSVTIVGAMEAPIVRLECVLRGQLQPQLVRRLYQFVVGNSFAFEKMMHEEAEYTCTCFFYFSPDGRMERFVIERGVVSTFREYLGDLRALGLTPRVHGDLEHFGTWESLGHRHRTFME